VTLEQTQIGPVVSLQSASVRDYLVSVLRGEATEHVFLLVGAISFDQVALLWNYACDSEGTPDASVISAAGDAAIRTFDRADVGIQVLQGLRESLAVRTQALPLERRLLI